MLGIVSYGAYVPKYRLNRELIKNAWGQSFLKGERAVANFDEDSLTMAVEAAFNCLEGNDKSSVESVFFASVTPPYLEKQSSGLISTVCDLPRSASTIDISGSTRASSAGLKTACQVAAAEPGKQVLLCAADIRRAQPGSDLEQYFGDGAAALLIGNKDPLATLEGSFTVYEEFLDTWRKQDDEFPRRGDTAFVQKYGYQRLVKDCVAGLMDKQGLGVKDISKLILNAPDPKSPQAVAKSLEFSTEQLLDPLLTSVGDAGNASALMLLVHAIEQAKPGDTLLLCNYSAGGADAFLFKVTEAINSQPSRRGIDYYLKRRREMVPYEKLLKFRGHVPDEGFRPFSSATLAWKEIKQNLKLLGQKCKECGHAWYPRRRACPKCGTLDQFEDVRLGTNGRVYTFSHDHLFPSLDSPTTTAVADLDGGMRFYGQVTDCDAASVDIRMPVELVFRRLHEGGGFINYFWKLRPVES